MKTIYIILFILFSIDCTYSFYQFYQTQIDGDLAALILPSEWYSKVLTDPFGFQAAFGGEKYAGTNRFFAHWTLGTYFKNAPFFFQYFTTPLDSIYVSAAFSKLVIQLLCIFTLSLYISTEFEQKRTLSKFLLGAVLVTPMFQMVGYNDYMGVIDYAVTYSFFYALPTGLLFLFFYPFYQKVLNEKPLSWGILRKIGFVCCILFLSFNGPLIPAIILVVCPSVLVYFWFKNFSKNVSLPIIQRFFNSIFQISPTLLYFFVFATVVCLYSMYVGSFNAENPTNPLPLAERYAKLLIGIQKTLTTKLGHSLVLTGILINILLIHWQKNKYPEAKRILFIANCVLVFSLVYIALIPLGGYRDYRPYILRRDTILPVTFCLLFLYGKTSLFLLNHLSTTNKKWYIPFLVLIAGIYTWADTDKVMAMNTCERKSIQNVIDATDEPVKLKYECNIMSWVKMNIPSDSEHNARLLEYWRVTKNKKLYYQE